jgi:hypothetical protein
MMLTLEGVKPKGSLEHEVGCGTRQWPRNIELPASLSESCASDEVSAASSYQPVNHTNSFSIVAGILFLASPLIQAISNIQLKYFHRSML